MTVDDKERLPEEETLKLYFECFKHLTTLNTAAALVVLTFYRDTPLSTFALFVPHFVPASETCLEAL